MITDRASLIKFQIGPVQDFIAAARSTRDLWSGSYLLGFLVAAGIRELVRQQGKLIFPEGGIEPLLKDPAAWCEETTRTLLTPNLPNLFVAEISAEGSREVAGKVVDAIQQKWALIARISFEALVAQGILRSEQESAFTGQAAAFFSVSWQITPSRGTYKNDYENNGRLLDAVRQTRDFRATPSDSGDKDSLTGREIGLVRGSEAMRKAIRNKDYKNLFKHDDHLSAITLIKRVWHLAYLVDGLKLKADSNGFPIRSTRAIAARDNKRDEEDDTDNAPGEKYLAAIAFDGDSIGKWVSGETLDDRSDLRAHHQAFSRCLTGFALDAVREIVESKDARTGVPLGFLIYAGGDDVVALVPADAALKVARKIREEFVTATDSIKDKDGQSPDGSAGIAIAHFKAPLQDLIREAQKAEKDAKCDSDKGGQGRSAFSITLLKRSGEISKWGANWSSGAIELHDAIFKAMTDGPLSARFPHRVCQLLEPYRTTRTGLSRQQDVVDFPVREVIEKEFLHTATRQGSKETAALLKPLLDTYLTALGTDPQPCLSSVIGLCTTLAFTLRNLPTADRQSATA
jgi:CRISPR-associated protein Cmr2